MSPAEAEMWNEANDRLARGGHKAQSPCSDCTMVFALSMREQDRCNGKPPPVLSSKVTEARRRENAAAQRRYYARKVAA